MPEGAGLPSQNPLFVTLRKHRPKPRQYRVNSHFSIITHCVKIMFCKLQKKFPKTKQCEMISPPQGDLF
jgi:hypothetical protein